MPCGSTWPLSRRSAPLRPNSPRDCALERCRPCMQWCATQGSILELRKRSRPTASIRRSGSITWGISCSSMNCCRCCSSQAAWLSSPAASTIPRRSPECPHPLGTIQPPWPAANSAPLPRPTNHWLRVCAVIAPRNWPTSTSHTRLPAAYRSASRPTPSTPASCPEPA